MKNYDVTLAYVIFAHRPDGVLVRGRTIVDTVTVGAYDVDSAGEMAVESVHLEHEPYRVMIEEVISIVPVLRNYFERIAG